MMGNQEPIPAMLFLKNVTLRCFLGVHADEHEHEHEVRMQLYLWTDIAKASHSDQIEDALDYSTIYKEVVKCVEHAHFSLIERLAYEVATICLQHPLTVKTTVVLEKMGALKKAESAGIEVTLEK